MENGEAVEPETPSTSGSSVSIPAANNTVDFFEEETQISKVKHAILARYLAAWLPKLIHNPWRVKGRITHYTQVVYIDGFAGPGKYTNGDLGSPLLALEVAATHKNLPLGNTVEIIMIFIEKNKKKCHDLKKNVEEHEKKLRLEGGWINEVRYFVLNGEFAPTMQRILDGGRKEVVALTPETPFLVFVDPFGYSGIPMTLLQEIMGNYSKSEIYVLIMDSFLLRFRRDETKHAAANTLFGTESATEWQSVLDNNIPSHRETSKERTQRERDAIMGFYINQLRSNVRRRFFNLKFGMRDKKNIPRYHLVYFTHNKKGVKEMKRAMVRKVTNNRNLSLGYSAFDDNISFAEDKSAEVLAIVKAALVKEFTGKGDVSGKQLEDFVWESTQFIFNFANELKNDDELLGYAKKNEEPSEPPEKKAKVSIPGKFKDIIYEFPQNPPVHPSAL